MLAPTKPYPDLEAKWRMLSIPTQFISQMLGSHKASLFNDAHKRLAVYRTLLRTIAAMLLVRRSDMSARLFNLCVCYS